MGLLEDRFGPAASWGRFFDVCTGTGSVAREVAARAPGLPIVLVDVGLWGAFWAAFVADRDAVIAAVARLHGPDAGASCRVLNGTPQAPGAEGAAQFIVIQRAMMMGRLPTLAEAPQGGPLWATACVPRPVGGGDALVKLLGGLPRFAEARHENAAHTALSGPGVLYCDPNYVGLKAGHYSSAVDAAALASRARAAGLHVAVSHHKPYPGLEADSAIVSTSRCQNGECRKELILFAR